MSEVRAFVAMIGVIVTLLGLWIIAARAAPPAGADMSLAPWFRSLEIPDTNHASCCDLGDCRQTEWRTAGDRYEAYVGREFGDSAIYEWVTIPKGAVLQRHDNPTGRAVLCWVRERGVLCFVRGPET